MICNCQKVATDLGEKATTEVHTADYVHFLGDTDKSCKEVQRPIGPPKLNATMEDLFPPGSDCKCGRYQDESHKDSCGKKV